MKFISLTLLSLASLVHSQEQHFTVGLSVAIDGASGDAKDEKCTHILEKTMVDAYAAVYPNQDVHLDSVHFDNVSPNLAAMIGLTSAGRWGYTGSGDNSCRRCNPMSMSFANKGDLLEAVGMTDAYEAKLMSMLQASDCDSYKSITDVTVSWIRGNGSNELQAIEDDEQHFTVGLSVTLDGAHGDPNDAKCTHDLESLVVAAYAATYPDSDVHLDSVHFDKVSPGVFESSNGFQVGTSGRWGYTGSGDNSCRRCNPMSMNFASKGSLLQAVGTTDAFEAKLLSLIQGSDCASFNKVTDVTVGWIRGNGESSLATRADEQHFTVGLQVLVDGASGDPKDTACTHVLEKTLVAAYAEAYPDNDVHLDSVHFNKVTPSMASMLRVATAGRWGYTGSGDNSCRRCNPVVSSTFLGKGELLEAVGTTDLFEAKLLSMLQASECVSFESITDVSVSWIRGGAHDLEGAISA